MKRFILLFFIFTSAVSSKAALVDSINVPSKSMKNEVKVIVIVPDGISEVSVRYPVVYLLHGYDGNEKQWLTTKPDLPQIADEKGVIFVCPDGKNSWYIDSPKDKTSQYETFISSELIAYIDGNYSTIADRRYRAITGLSMGGHGALLNAIKHSDVFGAAGSMSGAIDILRLSNRYGLMNLLGNPKERLANWQASSVMHQIVSLTDGKIAICFDCGTKDFTFSYNEALHKSLIDKGIGHEYIVRPGTHSHDYWRNSIDYHILFFCKFFQK